MYNFCCIEYEKDYWFGIELALVQTHVIHEANSIFFYNLQ